MRVLKGRPLRLTHTFLDDDGESPLSLTGPVTVTLFDGADQVANLEATKGTAEEWSVTFPAQPMRPYLAVWSDGTYSDETPVEVVGGFLFTVPEARNSDDYLADATAFPASEILAVREVVESEFEDITHRSFTTRVKTMTLTADGSGESLALCPDAQEIEAAWVDDEPVTDLTGWAISPLGKVTYPTPFVTAAGDMLMCDGDSVRLRVRYGYAVVPPKVKEVGMIRLRSLMAAKDSGIPDRAVTWQPQEGGTFRLATPGMGKSETGIPEVDAALKRYTLDALLAVYGVG